MIHLVRVNKHVDISYSDKVPVVSVGTFEPTESDRTKLADGLLLVFEDEEATALFIAYAQEALAILQREAK